MCTAFRISDGGLLSNPETEPLFKTDGPQNSRRVFDKTQVVQDPDYFLLDVPLSAEKIDELAELVRVKRNGQGVYRKVPAVEVHLERAGFDDRQRCRVLIILEPCRSYIHRLPVGKNEHGGVELFVQLGLYPVLLRQKPWQIRWRRPPKRCLYRNWVAQEQVADEAAHRICPCTPGFRPRPEFLEHLDYVLRKLFGEDGLDVFPLRPVRESRFIGGPSFVVMLVQHEIEQVAAGDHAQHFALVDDGQNALMPFDQVGLDFNKACLRSHRCDVGIHELGHSSAA